MYVHDCRFNNYAISKPTVGSVTTVYQETLTKGKFDEFDKSRPNRQTKTIQYKATLYF